MLYQTFYMDPNTISRQLTVTKIVVFHLYISIELEGVIGQYDNVKPQNENVSGIFWHNRNRWIDR